MTERVTAATLRPAPGTASNPRGRFRWLVRDDRLAVADPRTTLVAGRNPRARRVATVPLGMGSAEAWRAFFSEASR